MEGVLQTADTAKVEVYKSKTGELGTYKDGCCVHDSMKVSTLTQFDHDNCVSCCHRFFVPIGENVDEINSHNNKVRRDHQQVMLIWNGLYNTMRYIKPKSGASLNQQF